ncbi:PstS family phosphate ABC transporter substrate-binding protein [Mastigocoleus sp. MO_188.B34]|uniref:PstS family phosphate ABC transporter substrate-binding protein n=1 Tax=Mastigocoleus sp. MO_188.B34 TaxID=3036635 RepID=UPI002639B351|nr:PstS family phosphate ABC transporter substrate-binding protein [Mastigocoleus sp. MO_188.B34]MDJ0696788.1 PstS family phosphate ABC transporter substrate-binding protein [Mastigocoleus sp. MO_188.B34]
MKKYWFYLVILSLFIGANLYYIYDDSYQENLIAYVEEDTKENDFDDINLPQGTWRYGGSSSWVPIREQFEEAIKTTHPQFKLKYVDSTEEAPSSETGIKMLLNGEIDFSLSSRILKKEERQIAKQKGFKLQEIPVAVDGIAIAVNHSLNISGLTVAQLRSIYTGKIRNWQELGGPSLPIKPYSRPLKESATVEFFKHEVLRDQSFADNIKFVDITTQGLKKVANETGAIYYASAPEIVPQCSIKSLAIGERFDQLISPYKKPFIPTEQCPQQRNQVNLQALHSHTYPFSRPLYVIVKNEDDKKVLQKDKYKAAQAYAKLFQTDRGHSLIQKAGFIPIANKNDK